MTREAVEWNARRGFSLIETLIAVAIAGIAFFVLTETFFNVLLTLSQLESEANFQQDVRFVRSEILRLPDREEVERGGSIPTLDLGEARWRTRIEETSVVDLFRVSLEIELENPTGAPIVYRDTLHVLRPTWSDPLERSAKLDDVRRAIQQEAGVRDW